MHKIFKYHSINVYKMYVLFLYQLKNKSMHGVIMHCYNPTSLVNGGRRTGVQGNHKQYKTLYHKNINNKQSIKIKQLR